MPASEENLPSTLKKSADKIQQTYERTLDSAQAQYHDEARSHRTAWSAVKHVAEKTGDHWELKDKPGPSDPHSKLPAAEKRAGKGESYGGIDIEGNSKAQLLERAKRSGIAGASGMTKPELARALQRHEK